MKNLYIVCVLLLLLAGCVDQTLTGVVVHKDYTPASTSTGVGPSTGGDGGIAVVTTFTSEKWTLVVETDGKRQALSVTEDTFFAVSMGDTVTLQGGGLKTWTFKKIRRRKDE